MPRPGPCPWRQTGRGAGTDGAGAAGATQCALLAPALPAASCRPARSAGQVSAFAESREVPSQSLFAEHSVTGGRRKPRGLLFSSNGVLRVCRTTAFFCQANLAFPGLFPVLFSPRRVFVCSLRCDLSLVAVPEDGVTRNRRPARAFQPATSRVRRAQARPTETAASAKWAGGRRTAPAWVRPPLPPPPPPPTPSPWGSRGPSRVGSLRHPCLPVGKVPGSGQV